jgi:hypothetical protein
LLDREHYSEWLVSNLENSSEPRLPMWMLITQLYWKDLLKLRKYGRRLVTALISHHHLVSVSSHVRAAVAEYSYYHRYIIIPTETFCSPCCKI